MTSITKAKARRLSDTEVAAKYLAQSFQSRLVSTLWDFIPTHTILAFNDYGDAYELPMMRTGCILKNDTAEWIDEFGRFTYMTDHQSDAFLTEMKVIPA